MAINDGDILRCALRFVDPWENDYVNVWYFRVIDRAASAQDDFLEAMAKHVCAKYSDYLADGVSGDYDSYEAAIDKVEFIDGKITVTESYPPVNLVGYTGGSQAQDSLPPFNAPLITFKTAGVKTFCKKFLMPPVETVHSNAGLNGTVLTDLVDFVTAFLSDIVFSSIADGTIRAVVHSKRASAWLEFVTGVVSTYLSHQNRRKTGVGS